MRGKDASHVRACMYAYIDRVLSLPPHTHGRTVRVNSDADHDEPESNKIADRSARDAFDTERGHAAVAFRLA